MIITDGLKRIGPLLESIYDAIRTQLRATGTSFCFNRGRLLAVPALFCLGWLKSTKRMDLRWAVTDLATFFHLGIVVVSLLPETNGQELPE